MHVGDIDVMIDVYIYCLLQWNVKFFFAILVVFAECHGQGTRQRNFIIFAVCLAAALGKVLFKKNQKFFA